MHEILATAAATTIEKITIVLATTTAIKKSAKTNGSIQYYQHQQLVDFNKSNRAVKKN